MIKREKKGKGTLIAVSAIILFLGIAIFNFSRFRLHKGIEVERQERIPVQITEVEFKDMKWILEETGEVRPVVEVDVYPKVPGRIIQTIFVERGDYVRKGDTIAIIEQDTIKAQLAEARAALDSARANLKVIEANLKVIEKDRVRMESLYKEKAIARQKLDHIESQYTATCEARELAKAEIRRAEAVFRQLKILYRDHKVYAPVSGYVSARYVDPGAMAAAGRPLLRISREDELKIVTSVTEKDFSHIRKGMKAEIKVDAYPERIFYGKISLINPTIDPITRTGEIEIRIPNNGLILRSGMFARVRLYLGERRALVIPRDSLNRLPGTGSYYVYVVEKGRAVLKNIKTGITQGNYVEITDGLNRGDRVVVTGQNRLKDGVPVMVVDSQRGSYSEPGFLIEEGEI